MPRVAEGWLRCRLRLSTTWSSQSRRAVGGTPRPCSMTTSPRCCSRRLVQTAPTPSQSFRWTSLVRRCAAPPARLCRLLAAPRIPPLPPRPSSRPSPLSASPLLSPPRSSHGADLQASLLLWLADLAGLLPWDTTPYASLEQREKAQRERAEGARPPRKSLGQLLSRLLAARGSTKQASWRGGGGRRRRPRRAIPCTSRVCATGLRPCPQAREPMSDELRRAFGMASELGARAKAHQLHLGCISARRRLHLGEISLLSRTGDCRAARARGGGRGASAGRRAARAGGQTALPCQAGRAPAAARVRARMGEMTRDCPRPEIARDRVRQRGNLG